MDGSQLELPEAEVVSMSEEQEGTVEQRQSQLVEQQLALEQRRQEPGQRPLVLMAAAAGNEPEPQYF